MLKLSAVILTHDNQDTIKICLNSLSFADEIVVVDDFSSDGTLDILEQLRLPQTFNIQFSKKIPEILVYQKALDHDFAALRNYGLTKARGEWVLFVDADEMVSESLATEIAEKIKPTSDLIQPRPENGFYLHRLDIWNGRTLKHGETSRTKLLRLGRRKKGAWQGRVHETWQLDGPIGLLTNPLTHHRTLSLAEFLTRINWYTSLQAKDCYDLGKEENVWRIGLNPLGKFLDNYVLKMGFLDGWPGFCLAWLMSWHSLLVRVKLRLLWQNEGEDYFKMKEYKNSEVRSQQPE